MEKINTHFNNILKDIVYESNAANKVLNTPSEKIRKLEESLTKTKTHFVFSKNIGTDPSSSEQPNEVRFFLSWEPCSLQKKYRLFFIEKEYSPESKEEVIVFRKPFIECKLEIRQYWINQLVPWMNEFTEKLRDYRLSLDHANKIIDAV